MARFCSLFSGSSGNCLYVGTATSGILIDAGVSARRIERALLDRELDPKAIQGIFVTHEHTDHTAGLRVFQKRYGMPVFASAGTQIGLVESGAISSFDDCSVMDGVVQLGDFLVTSFATSHDSRESNGFCVTLADERRVGIVTDLGVVTDTVRENLYGCDLIHIESNHDIRMLENGPYPYVLKRRILSSTGHLSNEACAKELPNLVKHGTTRFSLGHLSRENNLPMLAAAAATEQLQTEGMCENIDYLLEVAQLENQKSYVLF